MKKFYFFTATRFVAYTTVLVAPVVVKAASRLSSGRVFSFTTFFKGDLS
jgi:hypothetical protein